MQNRKRQQISLEQSCVVCYIWRGLYSCVWFVKIHQILFFCGLPLFHKALLKQGLFVLNTISTNSYRAAMDLGNQNPCRPCFEDLANKFGFESQSYSFEVCSHLCRVTSITCVKYWQIENIDEKHTPQFLEYNSDFQYSYCQSSG